MKRKNKIIKFYQIFLAAAFLFRSITVYSNNNAGNSEAMMAELQRATAAENKIVVARIYPDWQREISRFNPQQMYVPFSFKETFETIKGRIVNRSVLLDQSEILSSQPAANSVVLLNPFDQDDSAVRQFLGNNVYVLKYVKGRILQIPSIYPFESLKGAIVDCEGKPFANHEFEIFLSDVIDPTKVRIGTSRTDEDGQFDVPAVNEPGSRFYILIKDANYGSFFSQIANSPTNSTITLPAISNQSRFFERSIWGTVTTPEGEPAAGALVDCQFVITAAGAKISALSTPFKSSAVTDQQGRFALSINIGQSSSDKQIPAQSNYYITVKPPETSGLLSFIGPVPNGRETTIVLQSAGPMRRFVFEDAGGIITDEKILKDLSLYIECADGNKMRLAYSEWKHGRNVPPGKYYVDVQPTTKLKFTPVEVNDQPLIAFQAQGVNNKLYWGLVSDGISGRPMAGVFVALTSGMSFDLSAISAQQWNELQTLPLNPSINDKALKFLRNILQLRKITRTDSLGNFQLPVETTATPISFDEFVIFQQNYLPLRYRFFREARLLLSDKTIFADEGDGIIQFNKILMFPGATVLFEPNYPSEKIRFNASAWYLNPPKTFSDFQRHRESKTTLIRFGDRVQVIGNRQHNITVPAGVDFQIIIQPVFMFGNNDPENSVLLPVITDVLNCSPGQVLDLGQIQSGDDISVFVKVTDSAGNPLEGVAVLVGSEDGSPYFPRNITDANGIARLKVLMNYKSSFIVGGFSLPNKKRLRQTMPFEIKRIEDANSTFIFKLTDEVIKDLFDPNAIKDNPALKIPLLRNN